MGSKTKNNELGPFEKGIDFLLHFSGKRFSLNDIKERYDCTYRQALRLMSQARRFLSIVPDGSDEIPDCRTRQHRFMWKIQ